MTVIPACQHDTTQPTVIREEPVAVRPSSPTPLPPLSNEMAAALKGRTVFIDPGHGGPFTGMVAPSNGIHEADVNLKVALKLRDSLKAHGAIVLMSRENNEVLAPENVSQDLTARAAMSNAAKPDVFISIHHNADVEAGSQKDDLEVYYKRSDDVASLDLGRNLISAIGRGIRFDAAEKRLLPGNYKVLRLNNAPSLLLETAYLTNDRDAAYLATTDGAADEANSILYGLASYFVMNPPRPIEFDAHPRIDTTEAQSFGVKFSRGLPIDLDTVSIFRNGEDVDAAITATNDGFDWVPRGPLPNGVLIFDIVGRNTRGAGFSIRRTLHVERPTATVHITQRPAVASPGNLVLFEVRVEDAFGLALADGTPVTTDINSESAKTVGGLANIYFAADDIPESFAVVCEGVRKNAQSSMGDQGFLTIRTYDSLTGEPVAGAMVWTGDNVIGQTNAEGWIALPHDGGPFRVRRNGYEEMSLTVSAKGHAIAALVARHDGTLRDRRIAIDPAHGGRVPGVVAPDGSRACDLNLEIAQRLARLLEYDGAEVMLTRNGDDERSDLQRINVTEPFNADVLLTISFGAPVDQTRPLDPVGHLRRDLTSFVGHYPQSVNGIRLSNAIADELGVQKTACVSYMVQQSQSAAVHVQPASLDMLGPDGAPFDAEALRAIAESIHRGIIVYFTQLDLER